MWSLVAGSWNGSWKLERDLEWEPGWDLELKARNPRKFRLGAPKSVFLAQTAVLPPNPLAPQRILMDLCPVAKPENAVFAPGDRLHNNCFFHWFYSKFDKIIALALEKPTSTEKCNFVIEVVRRLMVWKMFFVLVVLLFYWFYNNFDKMVALALKKPTSQKNATWSSRRSAD